MSGTSEIWVPRLYEVADRLGRPALLLVTADPDPAGESVGIVVRARIIGEALGDGACLCRMQGRFDGRQVSLSESYFEVRSGWHRRGIGTICLARSAMWAKHHYPSAPLKPFMIGSTNEGAAGLVRLYGRLGMTWTGPRPPGPWYANHMLCSALTVPPLRAALDLTTVLDEAMSEAKTCHRVLDSAKGRLAQLKRQNAGLRVQRMRASMIIAGVLAAFVVGWALSR